MGQPILSTIVLHGRQEENPQYSYRANSSSHPGWTLQARRAANGKRCGCAVSRESFPGARTPCRRWKAKARSPPRPDARSGSLDFFRDWENSTDRLQECSYFKRLEQKRDRALLQGNCSIYPRLLFSRYYDNWYFRADVVQHPLHI